MRWEGEADVTRQDSNKRVIKSTVDTTPSSPSTTPSPNARRAAVAAGRWGSDEAARRLGLSAACAGGATALMIGLPLALPNTPS